MRRKKRQLARRRLEKKQYHHHQEQKQRQEKGVAWLVLKRARCSGALTPSGFGLRAWLGKNSVEKFLSMDWRKRCVVVRGGGRRVEKLAPKTVEALCERTSSEAIHVWTRAPKTGGTRIQTVEVEDPKAAVALHAMGGALYCRASEKIERQLVGALLRDVKLGLPNQRDAGYSAGRGEVEMFAAPKGHETGWHYDFQENFTIQLRGRKEWTLRPTGQTHPLRARGGQFEESSDVLEDQAKAADFCQAYHKGLERTVVLYPGDGLYFPAGFEHKVRALDEPNLSLNVSLMAPSVADLVAGALRHALLRDPHMRQRVSLDGVDWPAAFRNAARLLDARPCFAAPLPPPALLALHSSSGGVVQDDLVCDVTDSDAVAALPGAASSLPAFFLVNDLATLIAVDDDVDDDRRRRRGDDSTTPPRESLAPFRHLPWQKKSDQDRPSRTFVFSLLHGANEAQEPVLRARLVVPAGLADYLDRLLATRFSPVPISRRLSDHAPFHPVHWRNLCTALLALGFFLPANNHSSSRQGTSTPPASASSSPSS